MERTESEMNRRGKRPVAVSLTRYDAYLAAIPLTLLAGVVFAALLPAPDWVPMSVSATVALAVLADGLFVHPPRGRGKTPS